MEHNNKHRDKFISMLKDSVMTLCKNGLMDDYRITRVEGLLGITLQNQEVFLINIKEELFPAAEFSYRLEEIEPSDNKRTRSNLSTSVLNTIPEKKNKICCVNQSQTEGRHLPKSPVRTDPVNVESTPDKDKKSSSADVAVIVDEDSRRGDVLGFVDNRTCASAFKDKTRDDIVCQTDESETEEMSITETSEPLELLHRPKDEPDDLSYNFHGSMINQIHNFETGFASQELLNSCNMTTPWSKQTKDNRSSSIVPCGYLSKIMNFPGPSLNCSSSPSCSSPPFASLPNAFPSFYVNSATNRSLDSKDKHSFKVTNRQTKKYCCDICTYKSNRSYNLLRHVMHVHASGGVPCEDCGLVLHHRMQLRAHRLEVHGDDGSGAILSMVKREPEEQVNS